MMESAKIRHGEFRLEGVDDGCKSGGGASRENDIIHINEQIGNGGAMVFDEQG